MASESELADLFLTLRAVTAPMVEGLAKVGTAGEDMVAVLSASLSELDARIAATAERMTALSGEVAGAAEVTAGGAAAATAGVAGEAGAATAVGAGGQSEAIAANEAVAASEAQVAKATTAATDKVLAEMKAQIAAFDSVRDALAVDVAAERAELEAFAAGTEAYAAQATAAQAGVAKSMDDTKKVAKDGAKPYMLVAAGVAIAGIAAVKMAANFQQSTVRLVTSAGESATAVTDSSGRVVGGLKYVQDGILALSGQVGFSAKDLSTAMYTIESGGMHGAKGLQVLKAAAQGAKTENADLTTVADAVTTAMTDYASKGYSAAQVTSKLVAATGQGKTTFQDLAGSMSAILPKASAAHIGLDEILGDIASMTLHGISARQATQNLANAVDHMQRPTMQMSKEMAALGLNSTQLSQHLGQRGLSGTIDVISDAIKKRMGPDATKVLLNMQDALKGLPAPVQKLSQQVLDGSASWADWNASTKGLTVTQRSQAQSFATLVNGMHTIGTEQLKGGQVMQTYAGALGKAMGTTDGLNVALMLTGQNAPNTTKAIHSVATAATEAGDNVKGWHEIQGTFNQKLAQAKDGADAMAISVGMKLLPAATAIIGVLASGVQWLGKHKQAATILAAVLGTVLAGALVMAGIKMAKFAGQMVVGPIKALYNGGKAVWGFASDMGAGLAGAETEGASFATKFGGVLNSVGSALGSAAQAVWGYASSAASALGSAVASGARWLATTTAQFARAATSAAVSAARTAAAWLVSFARLAAQSAAYAARFAATLAVQYGRVALAASVSAGRTAAVWLAQMAAMTARGVAQAAVFVAGMVARFTAVAASAVIEAAITLAAWVAANAGMIIATGGIILLLMAVVAGAIYLAKHWKQIWAEVKKVAADVAHAVTAAWDAVIKFLGKLGSDIGHIFSGAFHWLERAGHDIIMGLLHGIENAVGALWNGIKQIGSGIVNEFKSFLSIFSPSQVLADEVGRHIPAGIAKGMLDHAHLATNAARTIAQNVVTAAKTGLAGAGGGLSISASGGASMVPGGAAAGAAGGMVLGPGAVQITVMGNVQTERNLVRAVQAGILQLSGRNSGFGLSPAFQ